MRIKTTTYSDVQQKPWQFYWHGLLHVTIGLALHCGKKDRLGAILMQLPKRLNEFTAT
jgi:hypothetical protein